MWFIMGLGNPGSEYADTYHNVGFRVVAAMAAESGVKIGNRVGPALISGETTVGGQSARFVLPQTFMNRSGDAAAAIFEKFEAAPGDLVIVYDDVALPLGKVRVRQRGSAGGHNGVRSLISACGSDEFLRVRVGIKPDHPIAEMRNFVLSRVAKVDRSLLESSEALAVKAVETLLSRGIEQAMAEFNGMDLRGQEDTKE
ncbi:MAG TPA: aminoacyl-tRNA hydrolase [Terriglobia bacterium]|nr:aminoacyl-tRNA hydrolase [Terriglobia bacterium]